MTEGGPDKPAKSTGLGRFLPPDWMMNAAFAISFLVVVTVTFFDREVNDVGFSALIVLMAGLGGYQVRGLK